MGAEIYTLPVDFWETRDHVLPNGVAFLKGLRLYDYPGYFGPFWQNTSHCFFAVTNITWETFPLWLKYVQADNPGKWDKYLTTTEFLQIIAEGMSTCNLMTKNAYKYVNIRREMFGYSWLNFSYGFLQNVLAKILSINNIYRNLNKAVSEGDETIQYFDSGRLIRVLFIFDPIELENPEDDWYYNNNDNFDIPEDYEEVSESPTIE